LKRRRQLKQSQAEKNANEQSSVVISCSDNPNDNERYKKSDVQRATVKTPGGLRPGEWEQLPSEQDLNPFSRYEALGPKQPIMLDDIESAMSETDGREGEQTEKTPSDEGFTELEPTLNVSMEKTEDTSSKTPSVVSRDQQDLQGPNCPSRGDFQDKSICQATGKPDDEEDEGLAQNSSIEDAESIQSSSETEKTG
ncbi:unnamed protein product, partial [Lampetra planeri]